MMLSFKDIWLDEVERLAADMEEAGIDPAEAYDRACDQAFHSARDRLADLADNLKDRAKEGRL